MTRAAMVILALLGGWSLLGAPADAGVEVGEPREVTPKQAHEDSTRGVVHRELGITVGTPSAINLNVGYWFNAEFGVRASGLILGAGLWGAQGNLCTTLSRTEKRRTSLALVVGNIQITDTYLTYAGPTVDMNLNLFYFEIGPVYIHSNDPFYQQRHFGIIMQAGFMGGGGILGPR